MVVVARNWNEQDARTSFSPKLGRMADDDAALVVRAGQGDTAAYRTLIARHLPAVLAVGRRILRDATEAEDVAQEVMLRLWSSASDLEVGDGGIGPWLRRVASNLAIDKWRAARRTEARAEVPEEDVPAAQFDALADQDLAQRVEDGIAKLPERQRLALVLFHFEGLSQREVADKLDVSEDALESLLARARRKLKTEFEDEWRELLTGRT
jgi:RNA polymerase sigma-70 factor, ECF subfamily